MSNTETTSLCCRKVRECKILSGIVFTTAVGMCMCIAIDEVSIM